MLQIQLLIRIQLTSTIPPSEHGQKHYGKTYHMDDDDKGNTVSQKLVTCKKLYCWPQLLMISYVTSTVLPSYIWCSTTTFLTHFWFSFALIVIEIEFTCTLILLTHTVCRFRFNYLQLLTHPCCPHSIIFSITPKINFK